MACNSREQNYERPWRLCPDSRGGHAQKICMESHRVMKQQSRGQTHTIMSNQSELTGILTRHIKFVPEGHGLSRRKTDGLSMNLPVVAASGSDSYNRVCYILLSALAGRPAMQDYY